MPKRTEQTVKRIRSGDYLAEVEVELQYEEGKDYSPSLSMDDALRVERVFKALERNDIEAASAEATVYRLTPINAA